MNSYVEFERAGIPETMTSIDTADIIEAAKDVVVLWEHRPQSPDPS